jgi:hypothetical protein
MGFDWFIKIDSLYIDDKTGLPHLLVLQNNEYKVKPFTVEEWRIPERFIGFTNMRGWHLMEYVRPIDMEEDCYTANTFTLLYYFPEWESIKDSKALAEVDWDEAKHNLFKEFLEWCDERGGFTASWSY